MNFKTISLFLIILSASVFCTADETIYKWVDDNGGVHYAERAPEGKDAEKITTRTLRQKVVEAETDEEPEEVEEEGNDSVESEGDDQAIKKDAKLCKQVQANMNVLKNQPLVKKAGKIMTIKEKNAEVQRLQEIADIHC